MGSKLATGQCGAPIPVAGDGSLMISMPCREAEGHEGDHVLRLQTPDYDVMVTATPRR